MTRARQRMESERKGEKLTSIVQHQVQERDEGIVQQRKQTYINVER